MQQGPPYNLQHVWLQGAAGRDCAQLALLA